jgi:hypothetical protein
LRAQSRDETVPLELDNRLSAHIARLREEVQRARGGVRWHVGATAVAVEYRGTEPGGPATRGEDQEA